MPSRANRRRDLTPAQHAAIRLQFLFIPAYLWLAYAWVLILRQLGLAGSSTEVRLFRDFAHFYVLGVIANARDLAALYDIDAQVAIVSRVVPDILDTKFPPSYGPQVALFFAPLARLPYVTAMYVWLAITVLVYAGCGYLLWRACPRLRDRRWTVWLLLAASPALHFDIMFAQNSVVALLCVTLLFLALRAKRHFLAGLALGSLIYKPQLGLAAAFVFVLAGEWRIVFGAITGAGIQLAAGSLYWGPSALFDYVHALRRLPEMLSLIEPAKENMHSWRPFFQLLGLSDGVVWLATALTSAVTAIVALACWRRPAPLAVRFSVLLVATVLVNPHMYVYDFLLLTPVFVLLWDWSLGEGDTRVAEVWPAIAGSRFGRWSFGVVVQSLLYFCFLSPLFGPLALVAHVQFSVLGLAGVGGLLAWKTLAAPSPATVQPAVGF